jgi:hypothetical protein
VDFHGNTADTTVTVLTPPAGDLVPGEVGVRPTSSYWGDGGEQIDALSGNLNFTIPLVKAVGHGGSGAAFNLTYNSQNWRFDTVGSGGLTWKLGRDVGYGYGWKLQVGSITPYWADGVIDHYAFIDSTGAQYRLSVNTGGVWSSTEGSYTQYDSNTNRLYFPDGSFWVMGAISGGTEQDAGTQYPTVIEDPNGNQFLIRYYPGLNVSWWANSSARIYQIEDVRAPNQSGTYTWQFTYNTDAIPHLTSINPIAGLTVETLTFSYLENQNLNSPFTPSTAFGTTTLLQSVDRLQNYPYQFQYDSAGAGELTSVSFPYGGKIRWAHTGFTYAGGRTLREVQNRYLTMTSGGTESAAYAFTRPDSQNQYSLHSGLTLDDPSGTGEKAWTFSPVSGSTWEAGLVTQFEERPSAAHASQPLKRKNFTWVQDSAGQPYIGTVLTTLDPTGANVQTQTTQTLDIYGNVTQTNIYAYGNLSTPARTYTNTYTPTRTTRPGTSVTDC